MANLDDVVAWLTKHARKGAHLRLDSRRVEAGDLFVAVPGRTSDGRNFVRVAAARGAAACVYERREDEGEAVRFSMPSLPVAGLAEILGPMADAFYGHPSARMTGIAVTGTNGKTTTSHWCAQLLTKLGRECAAIGTVGTFLGGRRFPAPSLTTPDALSLQGLLGDLAHAGAKAFAIEASSIGLEQGRMDATRFKVGIFTNLTRDHLDYHGTMQAYLTAKTKLFAWPGLEDAVINADDEAGSRVAAAVDRSRTRIWAVSANGRPTLAADHVVYCENWSATETGQRFTIVLDNDRCDVDLRIAGRFNASNLLGVVAAIAACGYTLADMAAHLGALTEPAGRMQMLGGVGAPLFVVDYAHTPDALEKALEGLMPIAKARGGKLWAVFGCGGDRDPGKRPMMGKVAERCADVALVTSDNPRTESPEAIVKDILAGFAGDPLVEVDRARAIGLAATRADARDVVLVAGKGHEDYQEVAGVKHHYSDVETVKSVLMDLKTGR